MISEYYKKYFLQSIIFYFLSDLLAITASWFSAYYLRFYLQVPALELSYNSDYYLFSFPVILLLSAVSFFATGMYKTKKLDRLDVGLIAICKNILLINLIILALLFFYREYSYSRAFAGYFVVFSAVFIILSRQVVNIFVSQYFKNKSGRCKILLIGNDEVAKAFLSKIQGGELQHFQVKGLIQADPEQANLSEYQGYPIIGRIPDIPQVIAEHNIDEVFIALDAHLLHLQKRINHLIANEAVDINVIPDIFSSLSLNVQFIDCGGLPIMVLRQSPLQGWSRAYKRFFDIAGALTGIILFSPVMLVISALIKITSPGNLLYKQERTSINGRPFFIYKFRSMRVDAETQTGAVWASKNDDRTTLLGKFIRKYSLDELPQFFNVLFGEMSLVGPRPERPVFIKEFSKQIPNYLLRQKVKTGMTGWAQIHGWRGDTSIEKRIEHDLYYVLNWSIWLDIKIILMTPFKGFANKNAY